MEGIKFSLLGCKIIEHKYFFDGRGSFTEFTRFDETPEGGIPGVFVPKQTNVSISSKNVVRGLHYQIDKPQSKWVRVISGKALDVVVDIRKGSPSYGQSETFFLTPYGHSVVIPVGFAHSFWALENNTIFHYICDNYYNPRGDRGIFPLDPTLNLPWINDPDIIISDKDRKLPSLIDIESPFVWVGK